MKARVPILACSILAAGVLALAQAPAPNPPPSVDPPPAADVAPAPELAPPGDQGPDDAPPRPKKRIRIERRGPGNQVQVDEREVDHDHNEEFAEEESRDGRGFERRVQIFPGGRTETRIFRGGPGKGDMVIENFDGPKGRIFRGRPGEESRVEHVEEAIHHLHAAGLHDLAAKAEAKAEELRAERRGNPDLEKEVEALRKENEKLRKKLKKVKEAPEEPKQKDSDK